MVQPVGLSVVNTVKQKMFISHIGMEPLNLFNKNLPHRINRRSFYCYLKLFNSKRSFQEIAEVLGVSRQAVG
ncbi:MAG: hypothetical protein Athens071426_291 [Parcubacteria group bacterium Athens0714_26]|nr:MAG: hypothetical protein Athens101426_471 [Parcubacteria group bacterium Athens1014_26]TSD03132.1 MAG: hypothetical protein Athens071426_291 [Parcubacteria group bacterium Athens0714_26]